MIRIEYNNFSYEWFKYESQSSIQVNNYNIKKIAIPVYIQMVRICLRYLNTWLTATKIFTINP